MSKVTFNSIDEYIASFPEDVQKMMKELRETIKTSAPGAEEKISYDMPTFILNDRLVYFAAFKNHIGIYGASSAVKEFGDELSQYAGEKGSLRFSTDKPLPLKLISKVVKFRVAENLKRSKE